MGIVNPKAKVADSIHKVVWSYDPDVIAPRYAGWIPLEACEGTKKTADVVEVRGLRAPELAHYRHLKMIGSQVEALLYLATTAIVSVNGDKAAVDEWLNRVYLTNADIIDCLALYVDYYSRGLDPVTMLHVAVKEGHGSLATFHDAAAVSVPADARGAVGGGEVATAGEGGSPMG